MRRPGPSLGAVLLAGAAVSVLPLVVRIARSWPSRLAVQGHSMAPTLHAGDWLLVDPLTYRERSVQVGEVVVARDPRSAERWLVKRVAGVTPDGGLHLAGDHPAHRGERLPTVLPDALAGQPWLRYWPPARFGRVR